MLTHLHPSVALDMYKVEQQQRMGRLEHRRALMERRAAETPTPRPQIQAVRRATLALAGAGLALAAFAAHII